MAVRAPIRKSISRTSSINRNEWIDLTTKSAVRKWHFQGTKLFNRHGNSARFPGRRSPRPVFLLVRPNFATVHHPGRKRFCRCFVAVRIKSVTFPCNDTRHTPPGHYTVEFTRQISRAYGRS